MDSLENISPIDGRYATQTRQISEFFSEFGLIKMRVFVELQYFIALCNEDLPQLKNFPDDKIETLMEVFDNFSLEDAQKIKDIERVTNHDVKAVEYFLRDKFDSLGLDDYKEFIHFGLTSQDINNTAVPINLRNALESELIPKIETLIETLEELGERWKKITVLARTHGQAASPTTIGKEILVFVERLKNQTATLKAIPIQAKFGGATGNFNAHFVAYPKTDWHAFSDNFVSEYLGLKRQHYTTQIEHYDFLAAVLHNFERINTILIDFARDVWAYISMDYFKQKVLKGEVGSSAMPHKVNPIDFENAEGNLGIANANFAFLAQKLPVSRLQRDLTDSTVIRNLGVPFAHSYIAFNSLQKGISKLLINEDKIHADLEAHWSVVAEAYQTILRRENYPNPYDALKQLTRGSQTINKHSMLEFIETLDVAENVKEELRAITPHNYYGIV